MTYTQARVEAGRQRQRRMRGRPLGECQCGCGNPTQLAVQTVSELGLVRGEPKLFLRGHNARKRTPEYVENEESGCWECQRALTSSGYGQITRHNKLILAHRWYYEREYGAIPDGLELDHLCRNRACCNPSHLEPVTRAENVRRGQATKLSRVAVAGIRASIESASRLADSHDISRQMVWRIRTGRNWADA